MEIGREPKLTRAFWITLLLLAVPIDDVESLADRQSIIVGHFSALAPGSSFPDPWEPLTFHKIPQKTEYSLVEDAGKTVVKAVSVGSASGMIRKISVDPKAFPLLSWRWKATGIYEKGDVTQKQGDDYPARVYVTFAHDPEKLSVSQKAKYAAARLFYGAYPPHAAINYIWASKAPVGLFTPNPYTDRVIMIVAESGPTHLNTWQEVTRNVYEDYVAAFDQEPPAISGIAVMCDSDNTGESTVSYFGDIFLKAYP